MTRDGKCRLLTPAGQSVAQLIQLYESVVIQQESTTSESLSNLVSSCIKWQEKKNAGDTLKITQSLLYELFSPVLQKYELTPQSTLKDGLEIIYGIVLKVLTNNPNQLVVKAITGVFNDRMDGFKTDSLDDPQFYRAVYYLTGIIRFAESFQKMGIPEDLPSIQAVFGNGKISNLIHKTMVIPST
jgi:hypothetical protein